jgi:hypothetical protein
MGSSETSSQTDECETAAAAMASAPAGLAVIQTDSEAKAGGAVAALTTKKESLPQYTEAL